LGLTAPIDADLPNPGAQATESTTVAKTDVAFLKNAFAMDSVTLSGASTAGTGRSSVHDNCTMITRRETGELSTTTVA